MSPSPGLRPTSGCLPHSILHNAGLSERVLVRHAPEHLEATEVLALLTMHDRYLRDESSGLCPLLGFVLSLALLFPVLCTSLQLVSPGDLFNKLLQKNPYLRICLGEPHLTLLVVFRAS